MSLSPRSVFFRLFRRRRRSLLLFLLLLLLLHFLLPARLFVQQRCVQSRILSARAVREAPRFARTEVRRRWIALLILRVHLLCNARESCLREHLPSVDEDDEDDASRRLKSFFVSFLLRYSFIDLFLLLFLFLFLLSLCVSQIYKYSFEV